MKRLIVVFSHKLTKVQLQDAHQSLGVKDVVYMPIDLQKAWSNMNPKKTSIDEEVESIYSWIDKTAESSDIVLAQGEPGATYKLVKKLKARAYTVVYSTTKREAFELKNPDESISIVHKIKHVRYREY